MFTKKGSILHIKFPSARKTKQSVRQQLSTDGFTNTHKKRQHWIGQPFKNDKTNMPKTDVAENSKASIVYKNA